MCDNEATVHEVVVRNGQRIERHLCEQHAREAGVFQSQSFAASGQVVKKVVMSKSGLAQQAEAAASSCPNCGLTFAEFRQDGLLGCSKCYESFSDRLVPLLRRAHDGGDHHTGKIPKRVGTGYARQERLTVLRKQLKESVDLEQYEKAAAIRDQIRELENCGPELPADPTTETPESSSSSHRRGTQPGADDE